MIWSTKKIGEVCEIIKGKKPKLYKQKEIGTLPYLSARFMRGSKEAEYAPITDKNSVIVSEEDLIIICDGSKSGDVFSGFKGILSSTMGKVKFSYKKINPRYLKSFLDLHFSLFNDAKKGAAIPHLDFNIFRNLEIPVPSIVEQREIVKRIERLFVKIDEAQRLREESKKAASALLQSTLSEIFTGPKSKKWEEKYLREIAKYSIGLTYSPTDVSEKGVIVLRSSNIQNDKLDFSDLVRVKREIKKDLFVENGDILMCSRNGSKRLIGKTAMIKGVTEEMTFGAFMTIIRSTYNPYLYWFFKSPSFFNQFDNGGGPMINQITRYMLDKIKVPFPPITEQNKIVAYLDSFSEKVRKLQDLQQKTADDFKNLKKSILSEAFSGKL